MWIALNLSFFAHAWFGPFEQTPFTGNWPFLIHFHPFFKGMPLLKKTRPIKPPWQFWKVRTVPKEKFTKITSLRFVLS
jgi:hypothetical protein